MSSNDYSKSVNDNTSSCREIIFRCCDDEVDINRNRSSPSVVITRKRRKKRGNFASAIKRKATLHKIAVTASQNIVKKVTRNLKPMKDKIPLKKTTLVNAGVENLIRKIIHRMQNGRSSSISLDLFDLSNDEYYSKKTNSTQFFDDRLNTFVWFHDGTFLGSAKDTLTGDRHIILCEFSEQHPVFISQPGMHSRMKNLAFRPIKSKMGQSLSGNEGDFGEIKFVDENEISPLIGRLKTDEILSYVENKMFRAPIYEQKLSQSDFLMRATSQCFVISPYVKIYCVGQELPLMTVPSPESRRAAILANNLLKFYVNRLFAQSTEVPKHLKMSTLRTIVPYFCESKLRKQLRTCSNFKRRKDTDVPGHWLLNQNFRLPSKDVLNQMVTPEDYCAYNSMLSAQYRLKIGGYDSQSSDSFNTFSKLLAEEFSDRDDDSLCYEQERPHIDEEVKCAPWNTTKAFLNAVTKQRYFEVFGQTDPTGCGEGFSFARLHNKPKHPKRKREKVVADLRKITLESARNMLLDVGISKEEVENIPRWQVIDVIRTLSTKQRSNSMLNAGNSSDFLNQVQFRLVTSFYHTDLIKYARMARVDYSLTEYTSFIESCQKVFELQNCALAKQDTDINCQSEDSADSDIEVLDVEVPHSSDFFQKLRLHNVKKDPDEESVDILCMGPNKNPSQTNLIIYRTYKDENGSEYTNSELINDHNLAKLYVRIRESFEDSSIRKIICSEKEYKLDMRRAKRRLQDKLRRIKRKEKLAALGVELCPRRKSTRLKNSPKPKSENLLKMRCSACFQLGHMKTNKYCPARKKSSGRVDGPSAERATDSLTDKNLGTFVHGLKINLEKRLRLPSQKGTSKPSLIAKLSAGDKPNDENIGRYSGADEESEVPQSNLFDIFTKTTQNLQEDVEPGKELNPSPSAQSVALNRILSVAIRDLSTISTRSDTGKFIYAKLMILEKCDKLKYDSLEDFWTDFDHTLVKTVTRSESSVFRKDLAKAVTKQAVENMVRQIESSAQRSAVSEIDGREHSRKITRDNYIKIEIGDDFDRRI